MNRCAWLMAGLVLVGCGDCGGGGTLKPPGDEVLGTFTLHSKGIYQACSIPSYPAAFDYVGTFSRFKDGGAVFFTAGDTRYDAGFDGQFAYYDKTEILSIQLADGGNCNQCEMKRVQRAQLALLSPSQSAAVGDVCPTTALDGGLPAPDEDAGIKLPGPGEDGGFDAVLACGELRLTITGEGFCDQACYSCLQQFRISGERSK